MNFLTYDEYVGVFESHDDDFVIDESLTEVVDKIKSAIQNKFTSTIYYKGETRGIVDDGYRLIEPYALGTNRLGNMVMRAWLIRGMSKLGKKDPSQVPGWRLYRVDRIFIYNLALRKFDIPRKGYNRIDKHMTDVICSVDF